MKGVFITGTDTNVGKTLISSIFCASLLQRGKSFTYFKPIQTGLDKDVQTVADLAALEADSIDSSVYHYPEPISPNRASALHGDTIEISAIQDYQSAHPSPFRVVEGAGGVMVPLSSSSLMADLIESMKLPTLVVASTKLGTINHTLLTLHYLKSRKIKVLGVVLNGVDDPGLSEVIEAHSQIPILATVPFFSVVSNGEIQKFCERNPFHQIFRVLEASP